MKADGFLAAIAAPNDLTRSRVSCCSDFLFTLSATGRTLSNDVRGSNTKSSLAALASFEAALLSSLDAVVNVFESGCIAILFTLLNVEKNYERVAIHYR